MTVPHVFACSSYRPQAPVEDTVVVPHFLACKLVSGVTLIRTAIVLFSVGKVLKCTLVESMGAMKDAGSGRQLPRSSMFCSSITTAHGI